MRKDLTFEDLIYFRGVKGVCPVCMGELQYNIRTGRNGQWAHYLCNDKVNLSRYGKAVVGSNLNGVLACSLKCNNAVQLKYAAQPVLCDRMAKNIMEEDVDCKPDS